MRPENPVWGKQQRVEGGSRVDPDDEDLGGWVFMQRWM